MNRQRSMNNRSAVHLPGNHRQTWPSVQLTVSGKTSLSPGLQGQLSCRTSSLTRGSLLRPVSVRLRAPRAGAFCHLSRAPVFRPLSVHRREGSQSLPLLGCCFFLLCLPRKTRHTRRNQSEARALLPREKMKFHHLPGAF